MISLARHDESGAERILVVCTRYIGDTLLAIPLLRNLRRAFPAATIEVCAEGGARAALAACPYVDELVTWKRPAARAGLLAQVRAIAAEAAWLRSRRYTRAYLLKRSLSAAALVRLAGIPHRVGFAGESSLLLTRAARLDRGRHQADVYLDLLRADGLDVDDGRLENWVAAEAEVRVGRLMASLAPTRPRVFVAMRSTNDDKHWPAERWREVVTTLVVDRGCDVILCGGPADAAAHDALRAACDPAVTRHLHDFSASVPLAETAALVARADLCIGVDTGLVHLAASLGVPVAVLFGPTDPVRWGPRARQSIVLRSTDADVVARRRPAGMEEIVVGEVLSAAESLLPAMRPAGGLRTLDFRTGSFRYEVVETPSAASPAVEPGVPVAAAESVTPAE